MLKMGKHVPAATALWLLVMSCGGEPTAPADPPSTGALEVIVLTSGGDRDNDGYSVYVDTTLHLVPGSQQIGADIGTDQSVLSISAVPVGTHTLTLDRIAANCVVSGTNPRQFAVAAGQKTVVTVSVECLATGIEVSAHTVGFDNPPSYGLVVDGRFAAGVGPNGTALITRLTPGSHVIAIGVRGDNCDVANGRQNTVTVTSRSIAPVAFDVSCAHAIRRERIAYAVDTIVDGINGTWIVLINPDGTGGSAVVRGGHPTWSPDGTRIAYSNTLCELYAQYYGNSCGGGIEIIDPERWTSSVMVDGSSGLAPAWAPRGEAIAFTRCCSTQDRGRVYVGNADGSPPVASFAIASANVGEPSWSPDGLHIALACSTANGLDTDLCIAGKDSAGFRWLGVGPVVQSPAWSPDGKRIAFAHAASRTANLEVVLLDVNTLTSTTLTDGSDPAWSPDGTRLVVVTGSGLYVINADGTNKRRITQGVAYAPAWRP